MNEVKTIDTGSFTEEVLNSERPVLVDFYAGWCAPCKALEPVVDALAREYSGQLEVRKVDVDAEPDLARRYRVHGIPNLVLFKQGEPVESLFGAVPRSQISDLIDRHTH
jgi:thioredoxin 1